MVGRNRPPEPEVISGKESAIDRLTAVLTAPTMLPLSDAIPTLTTAAGTDPYVPC